MQNIRKSFGLTNNLSTATDVMRLQQIETPFYAKAVKSKLRLSDVAKEKIGIFDESEYAPPILNDVTSEYKFWGNLCKWSLKNDVVKPQQIRDFLSSTFDDQENHALSIINKVMTSIKQTTELCLIRSESIFSDIKLSDNMDKWFYGDSYGWGFDIDYNNDSEFGSDDDENGDSNESMAIRLTSPAFVATANMDIRNYPPVISNKLYNIISDVAAQSYKSTTFGMMDDYGITYINYALYDCDESIIDDFASEITPDQLPRLRKLIFTDQLDMSVLCSVLTEIAPKSMIAHGGNITEIETVEAIYEFISATKCNTLFNTAPIQTDLSFKDRLAQHCIQLNEMITTISISQIERTKLNAALSIFKRISENFDVSEQANNNAWIIGSDVNLYDSNYISFGTDIENAFLSNVHENAMSTCETAGLKLNLYTDESYIPMLRNITLIDRGLISLSDLL